MSITNDCLSLVTNGIDDDAIFLGRGSSSSRVLNLFRQGRQVGTIVLGDVYPDLDNVARQYRGEFWYKRLTHVEGRIAIQTVDDRTVIFDPDTGRRIE